MEGQIKRSMTIFLITGTPGRVVEPSAAGTTCTGVQGGKKSSYQAIIDEFYIFDLRHMPQN